MNDYDKAGRYLIKRDPAGFFRWLLRLATVAFHAWIDARRHTLPHQRDLTNDLVAAFRAGDTFEALCLELQAESEADSARRLLLGYVPRLLTEPGAPDSLPLAAAGGVVVNLTGPLQPSGVESRPTLAPASWLSGGITQRTLRDEDAAATLRDIAAGVISRWLLGWLPLMQGGAEPSIIAGWKREAAKEPHKSDRADLTQLTLTFATLAGCRPVWERALEDWAMLTSPYLDEVRQQSNVQGQLQALRETILLLGRQRFSKSAGRKRKAQLEAQLEALTDLAHLGRIRDRLLQADSWDDLLATP